MKLLIVNTAPTRRNGITNVIFNLLQAMDLSGMQIGYVSRSEIYPEYQAVLDRIGAKRYILDRSLSHPMRYVRELAKVARGYDALHVHGNSATLVLEMLAARIAGVKLRCAHSHNTHCEMKTIDRVVRPLFYLLCNGRLACGVEAGKWLFRSRDFKVVRNGVDTSRFRFDEAARDEQRHALNWEKNFVIGTVANFVEAKNHKFLIDLFNHLHKIRPETRLLLVGAGPLMEEAKSQVSEAELSEYVTFTGSVPDVSRLMSAMDLIMMPSKYEGLPLTLIEEQANGLHAVVSEAVTHAADLTGNLHFIDLGKGEEYWAHEIDSLIGQGLTRNLNESKRCIDGIKKAGFDIHSSAAELKQFYLDGIG